ncbi:unnamed protein product [Moneuplotes crassus]|uniref:Uncharacterized protein n=1 Tax=Euplotes crassus TaxID=5936 RepID=A0AAD2D966_EUPCR|nr:unnamed protein product [Moneuplotes crassus]
MQKYIKSQLGYDNLLKNILKNSQDFFHKTQLNNQIELVELTHSVTEKLVKELRVFYSTLEQNSRLKGQYKASKMYDYLNFNQSKYKKILKEYSQLTKCRLGMRRAKTSRSSQSVPTSFEITSDIKKTLSNYDAQIRKISKVLRAKREVLKEIGFQRNKLADKLLQKHIQKTENGRANHVKPLHQRSLSMIIPPAKESKFDYKGKTSSDGIINSSFTSNKSMLVGYQKGVNNELEMKLNMKGLRSSIEKEIEALRKRKHELEQKKEFEDTQIHNLNASFMTYESKTITMEKQKDSVLLQNSFLENELKERDSAVSGLVQEINNKYQNRKKLSVSLNISNSNSNNEKNKSFDKRNDFATCAGVTQDTRFQTYDSGKETSEMRKNFFSSFSGRFEEILTSQKAISPDNKKYMTQKANKKNQFNLPDSPSIFKAAADIFSDREISEDGMDIDDSLSDVPVRDCTNIEEDLEMSKNLSMEESEMILDNLEFLSPLLSKPSRELKVGNGNKFVNTPSFKSNHAQRQNEFKMVRHRVKSAINFDGYTNVPLLELGNIPEEIDESKNYSENTQNHHFGNPPESCDNSASKEEFKWNKSESINKSNSGTMISNSSEKGFGKLTSAFDKFIKIKNHDQGTLEPERLTFNIKDGMCTPNKLTPEKQVSSIENTLHEDLRIFHQSSNSSKNPKSVQKRAPSLSSQTNEEGTEFQLYSTFGVTKPAVKPQEAKSCIHPEGISL